jgi:hypothetical protein
MPEGLGVEPVCDEGSTSVAVVVIVDGVMIGEIVLISIELGHSRPYSGTQGDVVGLTAL